MVDGVSNRLLTTYQNTSLLVGPPRAGTIAGIAAVTPALMTPPVIA